MTGTIITYYRKRSFGWILPDDEALPEVFFHRTEIANGLRIKDDMRVEFELGEFENRPCAKSVRIASKEGVVIAPVVNSERTNAAN